MSEHSTYVRLNRDKTRNAICRLCGWQGSSRRTHDAAERDGREHQDEGALETPWKVYHTSVNRISGGDVMVIDNRDGSFDDDPALKWISFCDKHGNYVGHDTLKLAARHYAHPDEWCEACMEEVGEQPRRPRRSRKRVQASAPVEKPDGDPF